MSDEEGAGENESREVDGEDDDLEDDNDEGITSLAGMDAEDEDSDDGKPPPKETFLQKLKSFIKGTAQPATTYGPPYLEGMPEIDITLIEECDMPEPSVKDVHAILNEGVEPNVIDTNSYNDTAMIKLARHCFTPESVMILEKLKQAGAKVNKCNVLGITPLSRAAMARAPDGPPQKQRLKFMQWLIDNKADVSPIDKGGFTPMYHAAANGDVDGCKLLMAAGAKVHPNLTCKNPVEVAEKSSKKLFVILSKAAFIEETARKVEKLERDKAQARAAEHRRKLELRMAEHAASAGTGTGEAKYKLATLSLESSQEMARAAYERAAVDAAEKIRRKDEERVKQQALLKNLEEKHGRWTKVAKARWRFTQERISAEDEEGGRALALGETLFKEITLGPREQKLKARWREKTGLQKRDALPPIDVHDAKIKKVPKVRNKGKSKPAMIPITRSEWLSFPGVKD